MTPIMLAGGANAAVPDSTVRVFVGWDRAPGAPDLDLTGLLLGADGRVRGDGDMVFYNQPRHGSGAVVLEPEAGALVVALPAVPAEVTTVLLAVSGDLGAVTGMHLSVRDGSGRPLLRFDPADVSGLSALVLGELYRRGAGWKFRAVGQGWSDGLAGLARTYGITVEEDAPPAPQPTPGEELLPADMRTRLSLRKEMISRILVRKDAAGVRARVIIALDASGSLEHAYDNGTIARVVERLAAVSAQLTTDGVLWAWIFASEMTRLPDLTIGDLPGWIHRYVRPGDITMGSDPEPMFLPDGSLNGRALGFGNEEPAVMKDIVRAVVEAPAGPPVLVLFVSDGGVSKNQQIEAILRKSSDKPLFWQFVGIKGRSYGVLERLDRLRGRRVDNAGFCAVDDIDNVGDAELFERLLSEFPSWLRAARAAGVVR